MRQRRYGLVKLTCVSRDHRMCTLLLKSPFQLLLEVIDAGGEAEILRTAALGLASLMPSIRSLVFVTCLSEEAEKEDTGATRAKCAPIPMRTPPTNMHPRPPALAGSNASPLTPR